MLQECQKKQRKEQRKIEEITAENFPKLMMGIKPQVQEAGRTSNRFKKKKKTVSRPITYKLQETKDKEKILKETIEKSKTKTNQHDKNTTIPIQEQGELHCISLQKIARQEVEEKKQ